MLRLWDQAQVSWVNSFLLSFPQQPSECQLHARPRVPVDVAVRVYKQVEKVHVDEVSNITWVQEEAQDAVGMYPQECQPHLVVQKDIG